MCCIFQLERQHLQDHLSLSIQDHLLCLADTIRQIKPFTKTALSQARAVDKAVQGLSSLPQHPSVGTTTSDYASLTKSVLTSNIRSLGYMKSSVSSLSADTTITTPRSLDTVRITPKGTDTTIPTTHSLEEPLIAIGGLVISDSKTNLAHQGSLQSASAPYDARQAWGKVYGEGHSVQNFGAVSSMESQEVLLDVQQLTLQQGKQMEIINQLQQTNHSLNSKVTQLEKKLQDEQQKIRKHDKIIYDLRPRCHGGVYVWKLVDYKKKKSDAMNGVNTVIHSPGFYSSYYGYKLCIRLNLNGIETAVNTHISLFIHFMQGENDNILHWPFKGKITLTFIDQQRDCEFRRHISETLSAQSHLAAFQKPTSHRNHKGFGYMEFAPIDLIESNTFIKDDTMIIKVEVNEG